MPKAAFHTRGFSVAEIVVSLGILLIIITGLVAVVSYGSEAYAVSGRRQRAVFMAEEGIEAVRQMRDSSFSNLVNGTYGLVAANGQWTLNGISDTAGVFSRQIAISTADPLTKMVTSTVTWQQNGQRTGSTSVTAMFTSLDLLSTQANSLVIDTSGATLGGLLNRELRGITVSNGGSSSIAIDKVTAIWTNALQKIQLVSFGGTTAWSSTGPGTPAGKQGIGTILDIQNRTLASGGGSQAAIFQFDGTMSLSAFTITFTMQDGSSKTVIVTPQLW